MTILKALGGILCLCVGGYIIGQSFFSPNAFSAEMEFSLGLLVGFLGLLMMPTK